MASLIGVRPLGEGHHLVGVETPLGALCLLLDDTAKLGNLTIAFQRALAQMLADDLLAILVVA